MSKCVGFIGFKIVVIKVIIQNIYLCGLHTYVGELTEGSLSIICGVVTLVYSRYMLYHNFVLGFHYWPNELLSLPNNVWRLIVFAPFLIIIIIILVLVLVILLSFRAP